MSTLQQLSGLSGSAAAGFLPPSTKLPLGSQFPTDLANVQWNPQQAAWLDPVNFLANEINLLIEKRFRQKWQRCYQCMGCYNQLLLGKPFSFCSFQ